jgi:transposase InsO family protein
MTADPESKRRPQRGGAARGTAKNLTPNDTRTVNRVEARSIRRRLTNSGCRCCPTFTYAPAWHANRELPGVIATHQPGCPLGDRHNVANALGILPTILNEVRK